MYRTKEDIEKLCVNESVTLREAIKFIDNAHYGIAVITDARNVVRGILTDSDVRRLILNSQSLDIKVAEVMNRHPVLMAVKDATEQSIRKILIDKKVRQLPIVDEKGMFFDLIIEHDLLKPEELPKANKGQINIPVVIMAGGKGTRLEPFTRILPKPLIPIGDRTMIEVIIDEYKSFGCNDFYITVNHMANMIKAYFEDKHDKYNLTFVHETKPLGTAGSLKLLPDKLLPAFFVSNCDILIREDYMRIYNFHKKGNYDLTLVASMQHHIVPYGVCSLKKGGELDEITEKPEYEFLVNTGMYLLNYDVLNYIPDDTFYHITHLMDDLKKAGKKVGVFPVSEGAWIDVGQWKEYQKAIRQLNINEQI